MAQCHTDLAYSVITYNRFRLHGIETGFSFAIFCQPNRCPLYPRGGLVLFVIEICTTNLGDEVATVPGTPYRQVLERVRIAGDQHHAEHTQPRFSPTGTFTNGLRS